MKRIQTSIQVLDYNDLPNCLNHTTARMLADDTSISYASDSAKELQNVINTELKGLNDWLTTNKLSLNIVLAFPQHVKLTFIK